jgi:hypothetical protein
MPSRSFIRNIYAPYIDPDATETTAAMAICMRCSKEVVVTTGVHFGERNIFFSLGGAEDKRYRYEKDILLLHRRQPETPHVLKSFMVMVKDMFQKLKSADEYIEKQMKLMGEDAKTDKDLANIRLNRTLAQKWIYNIDQTLKQSEPMDAKIKRWAEAGLEDSREEAAKWLDSMDRDYTNLMEIRQWKRSRYLLIELQNSDFVNETVVKSVHQVCALFRLQYFVGYYELGLGNWLRKKKISNVPLPVIGKDFPSLRRQEYHRKAYQYDIVLCIEKHAPKTPVALQGLVGTVKDLFEKLKKLDARIRKKKGKYGEADRIIANDMLDGESVQRWIDDTEQMLKTKTETFDAMINRWTKAGLEDSKMEAAGWLDSTEHDYLELNKICEYKKTDLMFYKTGFMDVILRKCTHKVCALFKISISNNEAKMIGEYERGIGTRLRKIQYQT